MLGFRSRVAARCDDVARPTQHPPEQLFRTGDAARECHFGTVQHEVVRQVEERADSTKRQGGIQHDDVSTEALRKAIDPPHCHRVREQPRLPDAVYLERLRRIPFLGALVRGREYCKSFRRKPSPPLPEQRLDAANLRGEVIRDQ